MGLKERLEKSMTLGSASVEMMIIECKKNDNSLLEMEAFMRSTSFRNISDQEIKNMRNNYEMNVLLNWNPEGVESVYRISDRHTCCDAINYSIKEQKEKIQLRSIIPHLLRYSILNDVPTLQHHLSLFQQLSVSID